MAIIEHCICCSLNVATSITGIYALIAYVIAIVLELWWIILDEVETPAGAYLLCFGHFILLILSGLLLVGSATKKSCWLLTWSAAVGTWWIPEAALAIYMSLHHWYLDTPQGMTELVSWVIRATLNIAGIICVASQYMVWREEKMVIRRLQDLNMQAAILLEGGTPIRNGHTKNNGYHNAGFVGSSPHIGADLMENKAPLAAVENLVAGTNKLRRSSSGASPGSINGYRGRSATPAFGASSPGNPAHQFSPSQNFPPVNSVQFVSSYEKANRGLSSNEFNASAFHQQSPNNAALQRARSLLELQIQKHDYWRHPVAPRPMHNGYVPGTETQSLDRRRLRSHAAMQHSNISSRQQQFGTLPRSYRIQRDPSPRIHSSKSSLASQQSDDMQRYRDIAL